MKQIDLNKEYKISKFKTNFNNDILDLIHKISKFEINYFVSPNRGPMFLLDRTSKMQKYTLSLFNKIEPIFKEAFYQYYDYYNLNGMYIPRNNYVITEMQIGNAYDVHNDVREEDDGFSIILYVNDDFKGGELNFFHLNFEYVPEQGDIVIFPHPLYHSVNDVSIKNRYTIMISVEKFNNSKLLGWGR